MLRSLPFFIGLRYIRAKRRNHFISFISLTSMIGLALGVMVLIVVLSVMNGFDHELRTRILGMVPHATITAAEGRIDNWPKLARVVEKNPGIVGVAPFTDMQGMVTYQGRVKGAAIYGIDPAQEPKVSIVGAHMKSGALTDLHPGQYGIILGDLLARSLHVSMGDKVTVVLPEASVSPAGVFPRLKRFTLVGTFAVGAGIDDGLAYINIQDAGHFLRMSSGVAGLRLKMADLFQAPQLAWKVASKLPGRYYVSNWTQTQGNLFKATKMEKTMIGLLLALIIAVAAFNLVSTLVMVVTDKQGDIAVLRTLGVSARGIMGIFVIQGTMIGVVGIAVGVVLGVITAWNVSAAFAWLEQVSGMHFLSPDVYFISYLPSQLQWSDVGIITGGAFLMSFLATLYPARRAAKTRPAEALRYE